MVVHLVGLQVFIDHYPEWRELIPDDSRDAVIKKSTLDSLWSQHVCGTAFVKHPTSAWFTLTKKQKATFYCISEAGYESIYRIAKLMNRNYKRVHDDVKRLIELQLIQAREKIINGKRTIIVGL